MRWVVMFGEQGHQNNMTLSPDGLVADLFSLPIR